MVYIGIDPGQDGALAILWEAGDIELAPFSAEEYRSALDQCRDQPCRCCLERVWTMPGQGHKSQGALMENFGVIQGMLLMARIPYELVTPQKWKKEFQVIGDKNSSIAVCKRLFPTVSLRKTDRCRKDHDGMAEALLMAEYARRKM